MQTLTTINGLFSENEIAVPDYQRAYAWDTEREKDKKPRQVNQFLNDLEDYRRSTAISPYYFGHFLFERYGDHEFGVIDGQQRLTTIVIFLAALFRRLGEIRPLTAGELKDYDDTIKSDGIYRFTTVAYDKMIFRDYVIDQLHDNKSGLDTTSARRMVSAFDFFNEALRKREETDLTRLLEIILTARCTTHPVANESEAIQMFIFQNNRGKKPSNLEIIKAQFMFQVHLHGGKQTKSLLNELKDRFEHIYKAIARIEYRLDEDDVLTYTLRVYFNSLWEGDAIERINKLMTAPEPLTFIRDFTRSLAECFRNLEVFFNHDEQQYMEIHSLVTLGNIGIALPFIVKAYQFGVAIADKCALAAALEILVVRHRLIGTRADMTSRINDVFQKFTREQPGVWDIVGRINWICKGGDSWWWNYWNTADLTAALQGGVSAGTAKFLLWKYENFLRSGGKKGYAGYRYTDIDLPDLEHIAPQTPTQGKPVAAGYPEYDEEFRNQYINCLGNYLLLSGSHNRSIGNKPFLEKRATYTYLRQQEEVRELSEGSDCWTKEMITDRKERIIAFILSHY